MQAIQFVEAALQRVGLGEGDHRDANLLRAVFQQLENKINQLQTALDAALEAQEKTK